MTPLTIVQTAILYVKICCFISDLRPVVNFNDVCVSCAKSRGSRNVRRLRIKVSKFLKLSNNTAHGIILCDIVYSGLPTNAV